MPFTIKAVQGESAPVYPCIKCLIEDQTFLVLFTAFRTGICIQPGESINRLGLYSNEWIEEDFTAWYGTVTLTQA